MKQSMRRYRRASVWLRLSVSVLLLPGFFGNCNPGTITTTSTTELDTATVLQSLFRSIFVEPIVTYVNDRIDEGINNLLGDGNGA